MRHRTKQFTLVITALILLGLVPPAISQSNGDAASAETEDGERIYRSSCSSCHQAEGQGATGAFPPLVDNLPRIHAVEGGRDYLIRAVLFGVKGEIAVDGATFNGIMPAWEKKLTDDEVAAVLNHESTAWGNQEQLPDEFEPITSAEVAEARQEAMSPSEVHALRQGLDLDQAEEGSDGEGEGAADAAAGISLEAGVFTEDQAERGATAYSRHCAECHGSSLQGSEAGPGLKGASFKFGWNGRTVAELFSYTSTNMPYDKPGSLSTDTYIDLVARILQANDFPAGDDELEPDPEFLQQLTIDLED